MTQENPRTMLKPVNSTSAIHRAAQNVLVCHHQVSTVCFCQLPFDLLANSIVLLRGTSASHNFSGPETMDKNYYS